MKKNGCRKIITVMALMVLNLFWLSCAALISGSQTTQQPSQIFDFLEGKYVVADNPNLVYGLRGGKVFLNGDGHEIGTYTISGNNIRISATLAGRSVSHIGILTSNTSFTEQGGAMNAGRRWAWRGF